MKSLSDIPRTDEVRHNVAELAMHARQLERELNELKCLHDNALSARADGWAFARKLEQELDALKCSTSNNWNEATDHWVELTLKKYAHFKRNELTQVFMRGPFAGWSEGAVYELAKNMDKAHKKVPRHNV